MRQLLRVVSASVIALVTLAGGVAPAFAAGAAPSTSSTTASAGDTTSLLHRPPPRPYWSYVRSTTVHVRACASTGCRVVTHLYRGAAVHVYYRWGGWSNIGGGRWVASYLLTR